MGLKAVIRTGVFYAIFIGEGKGRKALIRKQMAFRKDKWTLWRTDGR